jgi:hypothetical protein
MPKNVGIFSYRLISSANKCRKTREYTDVKAQLLELWKQKAAESETEQIVEEEEQTPIFPTAQFSSVKKDVFFEKLTEEDQKIIDERSAQQSRLYHEHEKRILTKSAKKVRSIHPYITDDEVAVALRFCKNDEEEVCVYLTDYFNLQEVRKDIALAAEKKAQKARSEGDGDQEEEQETVFLQRKRKNKSTPSKMRKGGDG